MLRLLLEPDLAGRSAPQYTTEQLELLEQLCEDFRINHPPRDPHRRFHELLVTPASGPHATVILRRLWDAADRYVSLVYDGRPVQASEPYRRHRLLVEAAKRKRGPGMRKVLAEHLSWSEDYMLSSLPALISGDATAVAAASAGRREARAAAG